MAGLCLSVLRFQVFSVLLKSGLSRLAINMIHASSVLTVAVASRLLTRFCVYCTLSYFYFKHGMIGAKFYLVYVLRLLSYRLMSFGLFLAS